VSLDSVVYLEEVYGAIAYYLAHSEEVDAHLGGSRAAFAARRQAAREADPAFYQKLAAARQGEPAGS